MPVPTELRTIGTRGTTSPQYAPNFTPESVETVRDCNGTWVRWTYESGTTRTFRLGEQVVVQVTP